MDRRGFLRGGSLTAAATAGMMLTPALSLGAIKRIGPNKIPGGPKPPVKKPNKFPVNKKLETAFKYKKQTKDYLNANSPLRKVLMVDELPSFALARYEKHPGTTSYIAHPYAEINGKKVEHDDRFSSITEGEELLVSTFELMTDGSTLKELKTGLIDEEDKLLAALLKASIRDDYTIQTNRANIIKNFNRAFSEVEKHNMCIANTIMHPSMLPILKRAFNWKEDHAEFSKVPGKNLQGRLWSSDIIFCKNIKPNEIYFTAYAEYLGAMPIRQDVTVLLSGKKDNHDYVAYEEIGVMLMTDEFIARVILN